MIRTISTSQGMLRVGVVFMLVASLLFALGGSAAADNGDTTPFMSDEFETNPGLYDCSAFEPDGGTKWSLASFVFEYEGSGKFVQVCGVSTAVDKWQEWTFDDPNDGPGDGVSLHVSCSDSWSDGYSDGSGGPEEGDGFKVADYSITKARGASCGSDVPSPASIAITKIVKTDHGRAVPAIESFGIATDAGELLWNAGQGTDPTEFTASTIFNLPAGTYSLSELGVDGFVPSNWLCSIDEGSKFDAGAFNAGSVTLVAGAHAECEIVNDDLPIPPASLTLIKQVQGSDIPAGVDEGSWTLIAEGPETYSGTSLASFDDVETGDYSLSETGGPTDGWTASAWSCVDAADGDAEVAVDDGVVGVSDGQDVECTITNSYSTTPPSSTTTTIPPTTTVPQPVLDLAIDKVGDVDVDLDDGDGVATIEWEITVSHGPTSQANAVGATLSDSAPAGVTFESVSGDLSCTIADNALSCAPFDLALGDSVTVVVVSTATEAGTYKNLASVLVDEDTVDSNNSDPADVTVDVVLGVEILPETGAESDLLAMIATVLMVVGAGLVLGSNFRRGESFLA
jgi:hypothetical protein